MSLLDDIITAEGTGKNPRSSAAGVGQFIDSTWLQEVKRQFPQLAQGKSDQQILAMKADPQYADLQRQVTDGYKQANQQFLQSKGFEATPGNTYLAHFAGPGGAAATLSNPSAPVEQTLGQAAVDANPFLKGMNGADLAKWASDRVNGQPGSAQAAQQPLGLASPSPNSGQQQQASTGLLGALGVSNPFGGTNGALAQPLNIGTPLGNLQIGSGQGGAANDAMKQLDSLQPSQFGTLAPQMQRRPLDPNAFAGLSQPIKLGLLS